MRSAGKAELLIVDEDLMTRTSLSEILSEIGHDVRMAKNGSSAMVEIQTRLPDIILSALDMPGFEFLSEVRYRFPSIHVIAMSDASSTDGQQSKAMADAFYEKGTNPAVLLEIVSAMIHLQNQERSLRKAVGLTPTWIRWNEMDSSGEAYIIVTCPNCLRSFPHVFGEDTCLLQETCCVYCYRSIEYTIALPIYSSSIQSSRQKSRTRKPTLLEIYDLD